MGTSATLRVRRSQEKQARLTPYIFRFTVEPDEDRFYAEVPLLPGCYSWGYSYEEAFKNVKDALKWWLEAKKEAGEPIPAEKPSPFAAPR